MMRHAPAVALLIASTAALAGPPSTAALAGPTVQPVYAGDLPNAPGKRMTAIKVTYAPGKASPPHRHAESAFLIAYVLSGHVRSHVEGGVERVYAPGESWTEGPGAHHLVSRNASNRVPAEILVVFIAAPDAILSVPDK